jgi:hypothetical protein
LTAQTDRVRAKFSKLLDESLDDIGRSLVQKAIEGNYNAAQLLLRLSGTESEPAPGITPEEDRQQARIFFLEMVEQMLGQRLDDTDDEAGETAGIVVKTRL